MKYSTTLALLHLFAIGIAASTCASGEKSSYLVIDGEDKEAAIKLYREKYADVKVPDGPLKITKCADGSLKINFEATQEEPVKVNCVAAEEGDKGAVPAEGFSSGEGDGGNDFSSFSSWTINWNGPHLRLNLPSRASMRFQIGRAHV